MEVDYAPNAEGFLRALLPKLDCDFLLGSVHMIGTEDMTIWHYDKFQDSAMWQKYCNLLKQASSSGFYDALAHPDAVLRAGMPCEIIRPFFFDAVSTLAENGTGYEINCAGLTKLSYDPATKKEVVKATFPDLEIASFAHSRMVPLTIGSDAHEPGKLAENIQTVLNGLRVRGIDCLSYFENRSQKIIRI